MSDKTVLTEADIVRFYRMYEDTPGISFADVARAIERAVLAASELERRDAERGRFLIANWRHSFEGEPLPMWIGSNAIRLGGVDAAIDYVRAAIAAAGNHKVEA